MNKKIFIILLVFLFLGIVLVSIAYVMDDKDFKIMDNEMELDKFKNIVVEAVGADIEIKRGNSFSISYNLSNREELRQMEVTDDTFYFKTRLYGKFCRRWFFNTDGKYISITVPKDIELDELNISSVSGDIEIKDMIFDRSSFRTTSGDINFRSIIGKHVSCEVVSGDIDIKGSSILQASASGTSSDISFDGSFENVDVETVSGDCELRSDKIKNIKIQSMSGDIEVLTPPSGVSAESHSDIKYRGKDQGRSFSLPDNGAMLTLTTSSGDIDIDFK